MKRLTALLLLTILLLLGAAAQAQQAADITEQYAITAPGSNVTRKLYDRAYTSYWRGRETVGPYVEFTSSTGEAAQYLYICFGEMPRAWEIQEEQGGEWTTLARGSTDYLHTVVPLGGSTHFRLIDTSGKRCDFKINEVFVLSEGTLPDWVQQWEPTHEKADLLVLSAHPDDELIFFGGVIPTYAAEKGKRVIVAYMTASNTTRSSELLNGLWHMGVRNYPIIGGFRDSYSGSLSEAYGKWNKKDVDAFITGILRRHRPDVVLTHDTEGEYGHGAHRLTADAAIRCVQKAADGQYIPSGSEGLEPWQVKKLYLHLYPENAVWMDWRVPLEAFGGKTGLELAQEAYEMHVTQQSTRFVVTDEGETSCSKFGLAFSAVGYEESGSDLMENTDKPIYSEAPQEREEDPTAEQAQGQDAAEAASADDAGEPEEAEPAETVSAREMTVYEKVSAAEVSWPMEAPALDEKGYPLEGEHVYADEEAGVWFYASPTLVVRVDRVFDAEAVITQYEAQIYCDPQEERFGAILHNPDKPQKQHVQAAKIAKEKQVVFGMNTDYYTYRLGRKAITGMVIRGGNVFFDKVPEANRSKFPNLDTLAMYEDGSWGVYHSDELTAEEYLAKGAVDVFSFGPYLVRDGEINPFIEETRNGKTPQPRCAIGMIEPGHYYCMLAEGRLKNISVGVSVAYLAEHMREKGCVQALNMDGGQTAVMTFMGEQISRIGKYDGGKTSARTTTEIVGIGRSALIGEE